VCGSVFHIASRGFYARQDTKTPLTISVITFILQSSVMFGLFLLGFGPEGLAYAISFGTLFEASTLLIFQNRAMDHQLFNKDFWHSVTRIIISAFVAGIACYIMTRVMPLRSSNNSFFSTFPKFCMITAVSFVVYLITCWALRVEEAKAVVAYVKKILFNNNLFKVTPKNKK
jgi:peptidoglycan biosynthesis protein MviN/MurJ (putative lipid II flippase)